MLAALISTGYRDCSNKVVASIQCSVEILRELELERRGTDDEALGCCVAGVVNLLG